MTERPVGARGAWRRIADFVRRGRADERGVSSIEFALASVPIFLLMIGTIEIALDMTVDVTLQMAAQAASRTGLTMAEPQSGTREAQAEQIALQYLGMWRNVGATVTVTQLDYGSFNNVGTPGYVPGSGAGNCGDVESYNIQVVMPGFTGIAAWFGMPTLTFQRKFLVQNEAC
ncbi:TadE/TadG family type IV pilus assembly protein [Paraburkholderia caballeronis]|uniref:TadE/TadG family type IV pilus assembly protein n=1 Tax=Paraburkholderia caballeronis TaxID=416943 RepID=UPI0010653F96|nr:TadE/TadG family type IV pilus assembly protein [Paraburkholderia caballeronis]TDV11684.1 Flp pilus assembly protein TadG [Paraburkholderia caballeronis]TDV14765.1 Flp pilus assembly protein TadG [Paraburkholderia caballeronis]TDV23885.1 Flp pilus assembly protein TadG [Paraburkholderia caballeronis]